MKNNRRLLPFFTGMLTAHVVAGLYNHGLGGLRRGVFQSDRLIYGSRGRYVNVTVSAVQFDK